MLPKRDELDEFEMRRWLQIKNIPYENYLRLRDFSKDLIRKIVCTPNCKLTARIRRELYQELFPSTCRDAGLSGNSADYKTDEDLEEFFLPLPSHDKLPYAYKF